MGGRMEDSYIVDNSIHHSFQRAVTVHATHYALVKNNVAFDVRGHTFFVEDGNERGNVFEGNLAVLTRCSEGPLSGDATPASFWTSSPANIWRHNVAAGSCSAGWWFELPSHPGESSMSGMPPPRPLPAPNCVPCYVWGGGGQCV